MAHEIDFSIGRAAMAYAGAAPWHNLGTALDPNSTIEDWTYGAGFTWRAIESPVEYRLGGEFHTFPDMKVLSRSDTGAPLSVVSSDYKVVQPADVMGFFGSIIKAGRFSMETAGVLFGGRRIWAMAKVHDGAMVTQGDTVLPYLLLATSFDGTMATTARLTAVRVVCNNTLTLSEGSAGRVVRVTHDNVFDARSTRLNLGVYADSFEEWIEKARRMAEREIATRTAEAVTIEVISNVMPKEATVEDVRRSPGFRRVMAMFEGDMIGHRGNNAWTLLNAFTQYVDHERGRLGEERRFASAQMGAGNRLKTVAHEAVLALV